MTTIYSIYHRGVCVGRCDAKCHNAEHPDCKCICEGAHHGIGDAAAVEDRQNLSDAELLKSATKLFGNRDFHVSRLPEQMELFV